MIPLSSLKKDLNKQEDVCVDINCDLGQSFGVYKNDLELGLLPYVSSVNISCGSHAGDPITIKNALKTAAENNLAVGAHIGYPDIQGFGYRAMQLDEEELEAIVLYQIGALNSLAKAYSVDIEHVRPHGALYKDAATNLQTSTIIAKAIAKFSPWLIYVGAAGSNLETAGKEANIRVAGEVFLDKNYNFDGSIDFESDDVISMEHSTRMLNLLTRESSVKNNQSGKTKVKFNTIHLSMKSDIAEDIAKKTKFFIAEPKPVAYNLVKNTGWVE